VIRFGQNQNLAFPKHLTYAMLRYSVRWI